MKNRIHIFDTTLRDGSQGEDIAYSVDDKLAIAARLDELGVDSIEGGWPAPGNAKDLAFFKRAKKLRLRHARLVAFGSTCRPGEKAPASAILKGVLDAETPDACIFGKTWDLHVTKVLRSTLDENLRMVHASVAFLKKRRQRVHFDAEHFFDGFKRNPGYALQVLRAAYEAGADTLVLCDTNGGTLPEQVSRATAEIRKAFPGAVLGAHMHNDGELAVANSLAAVSQGVRHVQGTMNGYGERCGNANLASLIPNLRYKLGSASIPEKQLAKLTEVSRFVASVANLPLGDHQPFTGASAFAHKAGVHIDAILKAPGSYEHMDPALVGNERRLLASEQAGKATVLAKAKAWGVRLKDAEGAKDIIRLIKQRELEGYQYEGADASLELLMRRHLGAHRPAFVLQSYHVDVERRQALEPSEASVKLQVGAKTEFTVAEGNGPVNALDAALRKALLPHYPGLKGVELIDYKVRVLNSVGQAGGTGARVRVLIESRDAKGQVWSTVGVHANIIEASWEALVDAVEWRLLKGRR